MTRKGCFLLFAFICLIITLLAFVGDPVFGTGVGVVLTIVLGVGKIIFRPLEHRFEKFVDHNIGVPGKKCRIALIGMGRSGKTSLIRQLLTEDPPRQEESTETFDVFEDTKRFGLENPKRHTIAIADYRGQQLSQLTVEHPTTFFGPPGNRRINAILFIVDMFPELKNSRDEALTDEESIHLFSKDPPFWIKDRVKDQKEYITRYTIEQVFSLCYNKSNLQTVILLINKIDLLEMLVSLGHLQLAKNETCDSYVKKLFADTAKELKKACTSNELSEPSVYTISAKTGINIENVLHQVLGNYTRQEGA